MQLNISTVSLSQHNHVFNTLTYKATNDISYTSRFSPYLAFIQIIQFYVPLFFFLS